MISEILRNYFRLRLKRLAPPSSKPTPVLPLGLSDNQVEAIRALADLPSYRHYSVAMEALYHQCLSALLRPQAHDETTFYRAGCFWIEQILRLPEDLNEKAKELHARDTAGAEPDPGPSASLYANTPFWDAYQRLFTKPRQYGGPGISVPGQRGSPPVPPGKNGG
jgi:hypothetical protein